MILDDILSLRSSIAAALSSHVHDVKSSYFSPKDSDSTILATDTNFQSSSTDLTMNSLSKILIWMVLRKST